MNISALKERGLVQDTANLDKIDGEATVYVGFDPTADSLHVGSLLPIICLKRLQDLGFKTVVVIGGGTAKIGDPSGKNDMRKMLSEEELKRNIEGISSQIKTLLPSADIRNNEDWFSGIGYVEFLRDIGVHFNVNSMLKQTSYKTRMNSDTGLNFIELNYMLLQSFDFFHLNKTEGVNVQIGGSDQFSNMLGGMELIRKKSGKQAGLITLPLLTTSNGKKMGKTENGTIWLDSDKTSVFDFFQFWRNVDDADIKRFAKLFTEISLPRIESIDDVNRLKKLLAYKVTKLVHGGAAAVKALTRSITLFEKKKGIIEDSETTAIHFEDEIYIPELFKSVGMTRSNGEALRLIKQKGLQINGDVVKDLKLKPKRDDLVILKRGKKNIKAVKFI